MRAKVYNICATLAGERSSVNVWAFSRTEAFEHLRARFGAELTDVHSIDHLANDRATLAGTVLVVASSPHPRAAALCAAVEAGR